MPLRLAIIGFGEAGETFAKAATWAGAARAYDIAPGRHPAIENAGLQRALHPREALAGAKTVLSLVTAGEAMAAATACASHVETGSLWLDMNSVAPDTKRAAASKIESAGGRFVDVAVLAPVYPARLSVPLLVAGPHAGAACERLADLGFTNVRMAGGEVGRASAIKMIRSVMIKGIEALSDEMMAAARAAGVADEVLASLDATEKAVCWRERVAYNLERMATHGIRRAEEMAEAAATLSALGVDPVMTRGTVHRQRGSAQSPCSSKDAS